MAFKVACVQTTSGDNIAVNISAVSLFVEEAADQGATLIALPENVFYMGDPAASSHAPAYTLENHPGVLAMRVLAKARRLWIMIGSVAVDSDTPDKKLNRAVLIDDRGDIVTHYDKIHLFDVTLPGGEHYQESKRFEPGTHAVVAKTPLGIIGLTICYDVRFPHLYRFLAKAGAQIMIVPAAFTQKTGAAHWHVLLRARAIENGCFVIAPAQTGTHPGGRKTYGHSLIIDPWGRVLEDGGDKPGIVMAEVDLTKISEVRQSLPSLQHDRDFALDQP